MTRPLWVLPLRGVPCWVCGQPAACTEIFSDRRDVVHNHSWRCRLPNPGADEPHAPQNHGGRPHTFDLMRKHAGKEAA